jgi:hypothetical protein
MSQKQCKSSRSKLKGHALAGYLIYLLGSWSPPFGVGSESSRFPALSGADSINPAFISL